METPEQKLPPAAPELMKIYVKLCDVFQITPDELPLVQETGEPDPDKYRLQETCKHLAQVAWDAVAPEIWRRDGMIKGLNQQIARYKGGAETESGIILPGGKS